MSAPWEHYHEAEVYARDVASALDDGDRNLAAALAAAGQLHASLAEIALARLGVHSLAGHLSDGRSGSTRAEGVDLERCPVTEAVRHPNGVNSRAVRIAARERIVREALALMLAERSLGEDLRCPGPGGMQAVNKAEDALDLAARDLVNAINDLPPAERPKHWAADPEAATA